MLPPEFWRKLTGLSFLSTVAGAGFFGAALSMAYLTSLSPYAWPVVFIVLPLVVFGLVAGTTGTVIVSVKVATQRRERFGVPIRVRSRLGASRDLGSLAALLIEIWQHVVHAPGAGGCHFAVGAPDVVRGVAAARGHEVSPADDVDRDEPSVR